MSEHTYELIERIMIEASQKRFGKVHWGMIFNYCKEYIGASEKQEIKKLAEKWGVEIIGK